MAESHWLQGMDFPALPQMPCRFLWPWRTSQKTCRCQQVKCTPHAKKGKQTKQKRRSGKEKRKYEQNATASMLLQTSWHTLLIMTKAYIRKVQKSIFLVRMLPDSDGSSLELAHVSLPANAFYIMYITQLPSVSISTAWRTLKGSSPGR